MIVLLVAVFLFLLILSCVVSYTAGRAKGFEECYKQYVDFYWDNQAIKEQTSNEVSKS